MKKNKKENVVEEKSVTNKEEKKVEKVTEKKPAKVIKPVIWTILALSIPNSVVKFEEQPPEMTWYPITSDAKKAFKGLKRGDKVEIVIDKVDAESQAGQIYKKDGIIDATAIVKKEEPKVSEEKVVEPEAKKESGKVNVSESVSNTTNESIERQVAVKGGIEMVMGEVKAGLDREKVGELLKFYTKVCFEAMQEA